MIIDFHTHCFPDELADRAVSRLAASAQIRPYNDGRSASLVGELQASGTDLAIVLPVVTNPLKHAHINRFALSLNEAGGPLLSFGGVHPDSSDWRETLRWLKANGFRGIKLHPVYQHVPADDPRTLRVLEEAFALDLIVVMHAGVDISVPGCDEASAARLCRMTAAVPPKCLVLAHMGGWGEWEQVEPMLGMPGLWLDTAFCLRTGSYTRLPGEELVRMIRRHGVERVLFGSDNPWGQERESIRDLRSSGLTDTELSQVLGKNAQRLLGLSGF